MSEPLVFLIPALNPAEPGTVLLVRDPFTKQPLKPEGEEKPLTSYWQRRVNEKDCRIGKPGERAPSAELPAKYLARLVHKHERAGLSPEGKTPKDAKEPVSQSPMAALAAAIESGVKPLIPSDEEVAAAKSKQRKHPADKE